MKTKISTTLTLELDVEIEAEAYHGEPDHVFPGMHASPPDEPEMEIQSVTYKGVELIEKLEGSDFKWIEEKLWEEIDD